MSHHRCCCGDTTTPFDEFIPCIEVELNIDTKDYCLKVEDVQCSGLPETFEWELTGFAGLNQTHKMSLVSTLPETHPYGGYSYEATVPVMVSVKKIDKHYFTDIDPLPEQCVKVVSSVETFYTSAFIQCSVRFAEGVNPVVTGLQVTLDGDALTRNDETREHGTENHSSTWNGVSSEGFFSMAPSTERVFGNSIPNDEDFWPGCTSSIRTLIGEGSAIVRRSEDDVCAPYPHVFRFNACGYPGHGPDGDQPDWIWVDVSTRPTSFGFANQMFVQYEGWLYYITDQRSIFDEPVSVTWTDERCYPSVTFCNGTAGFLPYDPDQKSSAHNTAYLFGSQYTPSEVRQPGPPIDLEWSTDTCPGGAPLMANTTSTQDPSDPLKKRGMSSDAELDAMGHSPGEEKARAKQGGCCGEPRPMD